MEQLGYIKLHRKLKDNPISSNLELLGFLSYLMLDVNHKKNTFYHGSEKITLNPGEKLTSQRSLSEQFGVSRSKITRFLNILEEEGILNHTGTSKYSVIKLLNWDKYNGCEPRVNHEGTSNEHQTNTNKNVNNEKNKYIGDKSHEDIKIELEKFITYWNSNFKEQRRVTNDLIIAYAIIRKKYSKEDLGLGANKYFKDKKDSEKQYLLSPIKFFKQTNGLASYL